MVPHMPKRRQHYVPLFYLKNFTDKSVTPPQSPYIWVFERGNSKPKRRSPKNIGFQTGFYDIEIEEGNVSTLVEEALAKLESNASSILPKILKQEEITPEERPNFAGFVVLMDTRVPSFRNSIIRFHQQIGDRILKLAASQPGYLDRILKEIEENTGKKMESTGAELRDFISSEEYRIDVDPIVSIKAMFDILENIIPILCDMNWRFLIPPRGLKFVTSDNPVVLKDPNNRSKIFGDGYKSSPTVQLTFPLSPEMCMLATWESKKDYYSEINEDFVREINLRTCNYSTRFVYSSANEIQLPK